MYRFFSLGSDDEENAISIEPTKAVVYDDAKVKLMKNTKR
jgi:hypothetical protein